MKYSTVIFLFAAIIACRATPVLKNETRSGGYALGEKVTLRFTLSGVEIPPDTIHTQIIEMKTRYVYHLKLGAADRRSAGVYEGVWDGRKPDGRWSAGGRYLIYGVAEADRRTYSDTVQIGMAD
jgi:hypothetical protein